jgi:MtN3 and saliva related transmembrane protein
MLLTLASGLALWLTYGVLRRDLSLIIANAAGLSLTLTLLWLKRRYDRATAHPDTMAA